MYEYQVVDNFTSKKFEEIVRHIKISNSPKDKISNSFLLSLVLMPMMNGDFLMLSKAFS
jgi:hypothetical protein